MRVRSLIYGIISFVAVLSMQMFLEGVYWLSWVGVGMIIFVFLEFLGELGEGIPIKRLMLLIGLLQWVIAPFLSYHFFQESEFYFMQVPEIQYMDFVVPAIIAFYLGLVVRFNNSNEPNLKGLKGKPNNEVFKRRGWFLFILGIVITNLQSFLPSSLLFAAFLFGKLSFIGVFYLFAANVRFKYLWLLIAFFPVFQGAIISSVFHDMFLWGGFLFIVYAFIKNIGFVKKTVFISVGVASLLFIQLIKAEYREEIQNRTNVARSEIAADVANRKLQSGADDEYFQSLVDRLNQGWIVARIMYVVPDYEPFAQGETIEEGIKGALLPRFLAPNKIISGGYYFERFTGIELVGTSMNLGLVGEAYANYGDNGAFLFMFIFGIFFKWVLNIIYRRSNDYPEVLLWIPFLFLYVVKAEEDFTTMFNQFTKALFVMLGTMFLLKRLFPYDESVTEADEEVQNEVEPLNLPSN